MLGRRGGSATSQRPARVDGGGARWETRGLMRRWRRWPRPWSRPTQATLARSTAVREALEAARVVESIPAGLAAAAEGLLARLASADAAAAALVELGRLLDGEPRSAPPTSGHVERDAETIDLIGDFIEESTEALTRADELLLAIEKSGPDPAKVHALFRVFHTIKGVAGFLELQEVVSLAHATEGLLNLAREKQIDLDGEAFDVVFDATALLRRHARRAPPAVDAARRSRPIRRSGAGRRGSTGRPGSARQGSSGRAGRPAKEFVVRKAAPPAPAEPAREEGVRPPEAEGRSAAGTRRSPPAPALAGAGTAAPPPRPPQAGSRAGGPDASPRRTSSRRSARP